MRAWIVAAAAIAAFSSLPASAQSYSVVHAQPYFSFGFGYPYYPYWGPYRPYYYPYYRPGFSIGFGFYGGWGYPYGYPYYYGYPYGYPYYGYPAYGYPPPGYAIGADVYGGLKIQGAPDDAQIFVDGYYAGVADDFDGALQHMNLEPGPHKVEIRAQGRPPVAFDVDIQPGQTVTYHAEMK